MSHLHRRKLPLAGLDLDELDERDLHALVKEILDEKIHGIAFSPYVEGQGPGVVIGDAQIAERMDFIAPYVRWIRTFSCTDGNERIPAVARAKGLQTVVGVWLDDDHEHNERELENALAVVDAGQADILAVGNEVLLRGDLEEDELLDYIRRAKAAVAGRVDVGYVDAYFKFEDFPRITEACDVILANCYPFWEGCPAEFALLYMKDMYRRAERVARGRKVIITETGWPNIGTPVGGAVPSVPNAIKYFVDTCRWAEEEGLEVFYFSSFDETWKVAAEGDRGAYWGLWDKDGNLKYV
jgi:exo-beta-1,3-glucanase (GH17 family)